MSRRNFPRTSFDTINVTPLIDTLFFLLIIFMLTAPLLEYSVDVSPPKMTASAISRDKHATVINVTKNMEVILNDKTVTEEELLMELYKLKEQEGVSIYLRGDEDLRYGDIMRVFRIVKQSGCPDVKLITAEEQ